MRLTEHQNPITKYTQLHTLIPKPVRLETTRFKEGGGEGEGGGWGGAETCKSGGDDAEAVWTGEERGGGDEMCVCVCVCGGGGGSGGGGGGAQTQVGNRYKMQVATCLKAKTTLISRL